jgi:hypothetical protein
MLLGSSTPGGSCTAAAGAPDRCTGHPYHLSEGKHSKIYATLLFRLNIRLISLACPCSMEWVLTLKDEAYNVEVSKMIPY